MSYETHRTSEDRDGEPDVRQTRPRASGNERVAAARARPDASRSQNRDQAGVDDDRGRAAVTFRIGQRVVCTRVDAWTLHPDPEWVGLLGVIAIWVVACVIIDGVGG
jgi:hypothetical protein